MSRRPPGECQTPYGPHSKRVRLYPSGWECDSHSPWARRDLPEPQPGPGWPAAAWTTPIGQGVASVLDERAIASGKRRSRPEDYRAAQAATNHRKDTTSWPTSDTAAPAGTATSVTP